MGLFRRKSSQNRTGGRGAKLTEADFLHLLQFAQTRIGVEAYLEPPTTVLEPTVLLVAANGEWTRRRISGEKEMQSLARKLNIPIRHVHEEGYRQRMREWNQRNK